MIFVQFGLLIATGVFFVAAFLLGLKERSGDEMTLCDAGVFQAAGLMAA